MKLPNRVVVGSMVYSIKEMTREMHENTAGPDGPAVGLCDSQKLIIYVWPHQATPKVWSTLWHEIRHAALEEIALDLKDDEEDIVSHLERVDCMLFRDNPTLIRNLTKVLRG